MLVPKLPSVHADSKLFFFAFALFFQQAVKNVHVKCRSWIHSDKAENQSKNRYGNIVACKFN